VCKGVVTSVSENGGTIKAAPNGDEVDFVMTNAKDALRVGSKVAFNTKMMAVDVVPLPTTAAVESYDNDSELYRGQVLAAFDKEAARTFAEEMYNGLVTYRNKDGEMVELPFSDNDQLENITLEEGDRVEFALAVEDGLTRAVRIRRYVPKAKARPASLPMSAEEEKREKDRVRKRLFRAQAPPEFKEKEKLRKRVARGKKKDASTEAGPSNTKESPSKRPKK
jgi:hypothetical protein